MLPKPHRLNKRKDFERVYKRGESFFVKEFGIKKTENNLDVSRFAFVVSLKVSKKAVERNKIKRRFREVIREKLPQIKDGYDCVILTRSAIKELDYRRLNESVDQVLWRLRLLKIRPPEKTFI